MLLFLLRWNLFLSGKKTESSLWCFLLFSDLCSWDVLLKALMPVFVMWKDHMKKRGAESGLKVGKIIDIQGIRKNKWPKGSGIRGQ